MKYLWLFPIQASDVHLFYNTDILFPVWFKASSERKKTSCTIFCVTTVQTKVWPACRGRSWEGMCVLLSHISGCSLQRRVSVMHLKVWRSDGTTC